MCIQVVHLNLTESLTVQTLLLIAHHCHVLTTSLNCHMVSTLISLNAVTKNKYTQNAVFLKELWKKRRGAILSEGKPDNPKTRKNDQLQSTTFKTVLSNTIWEATPSDRKSRKGLHIADRRTKSGYGTSQISKPLHKKIKPSVVSEVGRKLRDSWSVELSVLEISENF